MLIFLLSIVLAMGKSNYVHMRYVTKSNVDDVSDLLKRLIQARDSLNNWKYPEEINCRVDSPEKFSMNLSAIDVVITEKQPGILKDAIKEYLTIVKSPPYRNELEYCQIGSDFSALESALPPGKKLKRKLKTLFQGKYVVDELTS